MSRLDTNELAKLLSQRSKAELVDWITEQAEENPDLRRAMTSFVAPRVHAAQLVKELNSIISRAWGRVRGSRQPWTLARPIAADLEPVLVALAQLIDRGEAVTAEKVLRRFVEAAEKGLGQVDDSYGYLGPLAKDAVALWGRAWSEIEPRDTSKLASLVSEEIERDGFGICDDMIRDFAPALGREGLLALKERYAAAHQANLKQDDLADWRRDEPLRHLTDVADALGDVDMYIDMQRRCGLDKAYALPIARRLLDAGRPEEALAQLERGEPNNSYFPGEKENYTALRVRILKALGRDDQADDALWQDFERNLSSESLDRLLEATPKRKQPTLLKKAIAAAEAHPNRLSAAKFLLEREQAKRAAALIDAHPEAFNGTFYDSLLKLAKALQGEYPSAAWVLYRNLLMSILLEKRTKAYHHAAKYLATCGKLATSPKLRKQHEQLVSTLREEHGRKTAFWKLVKE